MASGSALDYSEIDQRDAGVKFQSETGYFFFREHTLSNGLVYVTLHSHDGAEVRQRFGRSYAGDMIVSDLSIYRPYGTNGIRLRDGLVLQSFCSGLDGIRHTTPTSIVSKDFDYRSDGRFGLFYRFSPQRPSDKKESYLMLSYTGLFDGGKKREEIVIETPLNRGIPRRECETVLIFVEHAGGDRTHPFEHREIAFDSQGRPTKLTEQRKRGLVDTSEDKVVCLPRIHNPRSPEFYPEVERILKRDNPRIDTQATLTAVMEASARELGTMPIKFFDHIC